MWIKDQPENNHLMRGLSYEAVLTPEECRKAELIPADLDLTAEYTALEKASMPKTYFERRFQRELLPYSEENQWLFERYAQIFNYVNQKFYQFKSSEVIGLQRLTFNPGDYWAWHIQLGDGMFARRKITGMVYLSGANDYTGGLFESGGGIIKHHEYAPGSMALFPSYFMTQFRPVEKGQLKLLMAWHQGEKPFK